MKVKDELLMLFENNVDKCMSGAAIAKELGVSRNAVWKAVTALCEEGYDITSFQGKGYVMRSCKDIISGISVEKYLKRKELFDIQVFDSVSSTNTLLKEEAVGGMKEGRVIIASNQTMGRGRLGRTFYSPSGTGIYMSILLRPVYQAKYSLSITTAAAVAVAKAIEDVADVTAMIKWVNDIYVDSRKVCGILTEASVNVENSTLEWAVLGIGINIVPPKGDFPDDIKDRAGTIFANDRYEGQIKSRLAAGVINYFWEYYEHLDDNSFMDEYRNRSFVTGKNVLISDRDGMKEAVVKGIDDDAGLIVEYPDGTTKVLSSGEISIKEIR